MKKSFLKLNPVKIYLLIAVVAGVAYFYGLKGDFVYDDITLIAQDPFYTAENSSYPDCWKRTYWQGIRSIGQYRPLVGVTYLLNVRISGLHSPAFRLTNLLIHILISIMVFKLAMLLGAGGISATFATLLYAVHPIHTEAVIPSSGRAELLCALFILIGFISFIYILKSEKPKLWMYPVPALSLIFAMWSKENGIILIPLCILYDFLYKKHSWKEWGHLKMSLIKGLKNYSCLFLGLVAVVVVKLINIGYLMPVLRGRIAVEIDNPLVKASLLERLCTALKIQGMVFSKYIWPQHLSHDYSYAEIIPNDNLFNFYALFALFIFIAVPVLLCLILQGYRKIIIFLTAAYIISILPAGNFIVTTGTIFGERLYYTPSIWFLIGIVFVFLRLSQKIHKKYCHSDRPYFVYAACGFLAIAILASGMRTFVRSLDWDSQLSLAVKGKETAPKSIKTWGMLATQFAANDQLEDAVFCCDKAIAILPSSRSILTKKSRYLIRLKQYNAAEKCLRELVRQNSEFPEDYNNLAGIMQGKGNPKEAVKLLEHSLKLNPNQPDIIKWRDQIKKTRKQPDKGSNKENSYLNSQV